MLEFLFNNVADLKVYNFIRKRLHHRCFLVRNIVKFLRAAYIEHFWRLLQKMSYWTPLQVFFIWMNVYELFKLSVLRSITQYCNRWAIHLHYISMTQWQGKNLQQLKTWNLQHQEIIVEFKPVYLKWFRFTCCLLG